MMKSPLPTQASTSRDLPATATIECVGDSGNWRLETGGFHDRLQWFLVVFEPLGLMLLILAAALMWALPGDLKSWFALAFLGAMGWAASWLLVGSRRSVNALIEVKGDRVVVGEVAFPKTDVKEIHARSWMDRGVPGFQADLMVVEGESPILIMKGSGHPLAEAVLRRFCTGCGIRLKVEAAGEPDGTR